MCALLMSEADKPEKTAANLAEARRMGIPILPPSVNQSRKNFSLVRNADGQLCIQYGLLGIKGVGEKAVEEIIRGRGEDPDTGKPLDESGIRPYASLADFLARTNARVLNRGVMATLIKAGAFDCLEPNRFKVWNEYHFIHRNDPKRVRDEIEQYDESQWKPEYGWQWEKELMGHYISGHPLDDLPYVVWDHVPGGKTVEIAGIVPANGVKEFQDRMGRTMCRGQIETKTGQRINITIFADEWEKLKDKFAAGAVLILKGKKDARFNTLVVSAATKANRRRAHRPRPVDSGRPAAAPVVVTDPLYELIGGAEDE